MLNTIGVDFVHINIYSKKQKVKYVDKNGQKVKVVLVLY